MAHIIAIGEGWSDKLESFEKAFDGREYCNGKCKVRVREIKLYHFGFNECGYKEVLADIKSMSLYNQDKRSKNVQKDTTKELNFKFDKYIKIFRKFFKSIKPIEDDLDSVPIGTFRKEHEDKGIWFMTSLRPIGVVADYKDKDGKECV